MKRKLLVLGILPFFMVSVVFSQKLITEKQIPLTKEQKKYEPDFALPNQSTGGVTVYFEPMKAAKVKGEKRKFQRYEMQLDKDLNLVAGDFKTLGTPNSVRPKFHYKEFAINHSTWVDDETDDKINKMMLQLTKFDLDNNIIEVKSFELCDEKGFDNYRVTDYNGDLIIFAQYEKKKTKDKNEKNRDYLVYKRIDPVTLEVKNESELNLLGKDELGLEAFLIEKDKIFLVGPQLLQLKIGKMKIPQGWFVFKLNIDGTEEMRGQLTLPDKAVGVGSVYLTFNKDILYMIGEYGDPKKMQKTPSPPYGSSTSTTVKCTNPYLGIFLKKFDFDLVEKGTATFSYKESILKKLKKGNRGFTKKGGNYNLQDFYFLEDGSFYLTAEMFTKVYRAVCTKSDYFSYCQYFTDFNYMDGLVFKFNANGELDWLVQVDRDNYTKVYYGLIKSKKPLESGKLVSYLKTGNKMVILYNTPGRKYSGKRFGLSEVLVTPEGEMTDPFDYTSEQQFGLLDGGIIDIDDDQILAVGTDKKGNNLWVKKIKIFE
jgi:hypothetical protein